MIRVPTILEAVDDKHLLGATIEDPAAWRPWRALLAAAFGLPMDALRASKTPASGLLDAPHQVC
jgi:hypothetical protein